jgi:hypothetical protein
MAAKNLYAILEIAASLGIPVAEAYRGGVLENYERLLQQAALVMAAPLPDTGEDHHAEFEP